MEERTALEEVAQREREALREIGRRKFEERPELSAEEALCALLGLLKEREEPGFGGRIDPEVEEMARMFMEWFEAAARYKRAPTIEADERLTEVTNRLNREILRRARRPDWPPERWREVARRMGDLLARRLRGLKMSERTTLLDLLVRDTGFWVHRIADVEATGERTPKARATIRIGMRRIFVQTEALKHASENIWGKSPTEWTVTIRAPLRALERKYRGSPPGTLGETVEGILSRLHREMRVEEKTSVISLIESLGMRPGYVRLPTKGEIMRAVGRLARRCKILIPVAALAGLVIGVVEYLKRRGRRRRDGRVELTKEEWQEFARLMAENAEKIRKLEEDYIKGRITRRMRDLGVMMMVREKQERARGRARRERRKRGGRGSWSSGTPTSPATSSSGELTTRTSS